jgi:hypothetical protein
MFVVQKGIPDLGLAQRKSGIEEKKLLHPVREAMPAIAPQWAFSLRDPGRLRNM